MDEMTFIDKIRKIIKMRHDDMVSAMASGGVDNMEKYNYILGKIHVTDQIKQEISNLLNPKEPEPDDDKVTRIRR